MLLHLQAKKRKLTQSHFGTSEEMKPAREGRQDEEDDQDSKRKLVLYLFDIRTPNLITDYSCAISDGFAMHGRLVRVVNFSSP